MHNDTGRAISLNLEILQLLKHNIPLFVPLQRLSGTHDTLRIEFCTPMLASEAVRTDGAKERRQSPPWLHAASFEQCDPAATA